MPAATSNIPHPPSFQQYLANRQQAEPRVYSKGAAEEWVNQYTPNGSTETEIDPATGMPRFRTTVTAPKYVDLWRHDEHKNDKVFNVGLNVLHQLTNYTLDQPVKGSDAGAVKAAPKPAPAPARK
jgi:hypothetical protein